MNLNVYWHRRGNKAPIIEHYMYYSTCNTVLFVCVFCLFTNVFIMSSQGQSDEKDPGKYQQCGETLWGDVPDVCWLCP